MMCIKMYPVLLPMLFMGPPSRAQPVDKIFPSTRPVLYATTGIGRSFVNNQFNKHTNHGITTFTGGEKQYFSGLFIRLLFETAIYKFNNSRVENGLTIQNKGNRVISGGYADVGYRYKMGKWQPYVFSGLGALLLVSPKTEYRRADNIIATESKSRIYFSLHGGAGLEYQFNPKFILFLEGQTFLLPQRTAIFDTRLSGLNLHIGFKTPLKSKK